MKRTRSISFESARRITPEEVEAFRLAIKEKTGKFPPRRRGRPPKLEADKYSAIAIRVHPAAIAWAKREGMKRGVGYQTVINEALLVRVAAERNPAAAEHLRVELEQATKEPTMTLEESRAGKRSSGTKVTAKSRRRRATSRHR